MITKNKLMTLLFWSRFTKSEKKSTYNSKNQQRT